MKTSEHKNILPPPWLACPEIERYSIGWRMGYGEDYITKWSRWYRELAPEKAAQYRAMFPEPITWRGYWEGRDTCQYYGSGAFQIPFWEEGGVPRYSVALLRERYRGGTVFSYCMFWGHHPAQDGHMTKSCFSQWWKAPFWSETRIYCCMEQYMMAQKAELFGDQEMMQRILECGDPKQIKALGRKVRNFDENIWNDVKYSIVLNGNFHKFFQNRLLRTFLLATGDSILVEASPYDRIWGIGMSENDRDAHDPVQWRGQNLLGFALMEVRDELRRICHSEDICVEIER